VTVEAERLTLQQLPAVERARKLRELAGVVRDLTNPILGDVGAAGDAAVVEAVAGSTYAAVARQLGVSESAVNKAVTRHGARVRSVVAQTAEHVEVTR
jgi:hypothetical protein